MQQVSQYRNGERDYTLIKGSTGPLVYPAAHLYIYNLLYFLTDGGKNILLAQCIFGGVYLSVLGVVMACYRMAQVLPVPLPPSGSQLIKVIIAGASVPVSAPHSLQAPS